MEKKTLRASEQDRSDVARQRRRWRGWQGYMDPAHFVFLDETAATTAMTRLYGWGPRSERLVDTAPYGHWHTTTFVAGLRRDGVIAPYVLDGAMTGELFRAYVEQMLAPSLRPGDVVVLDNLPVHKVAGVREAIRAVGASLLYLPPYSPDHLGQCPKSDRDGIRQTQRTVAASPSQNRRRPLGSHRTHPEPVHL